MPKVFDDYSDERHRGRCFHCGAWLEDSKTNREHIPTMSLLCKPYPNDLQTVLVCAACNESYSLDEEYCAATLSAVISGSTDPKKQKTSAGARAFSRNKGLRERIERQKREFVTIGGEPKTVWDVEVPRFERISVKNARGHAFFENGEPMFEDPTEVVVFPLPEADPSLLDIFFPKIGQLGVWPEVGSRWMQRLFGETDAFDQQGFFVFQPSVYRVHIDFNSGVTVRTIIHEYLATLVRWN